MKLLWFASTRGVCVYTSLVCPVGIGRKPPIQELFFSTSFSRCASAGSLPIKPVRRRLNA